MSNPRDKMKSIFGSILESAANGLLETKRREDALKALGIDLTTDKHPEVIGKLAAAIVDLQKDAEKK